MASGRNCRPGAGDDRHSTLECATGGSDSAPSAELALGTEPDGRRTVVAFSTPSCAACHSAQSPAIDRARAKLADLDIRCIDVDAAQLPDAARAFGILTVPSTVVIAAQGAHIVAVNQGYASSAQLVEQLQRQDPV